MAIDRKEIHARMRRLQTRHLDAAQYAIRRREKGLEPNTVQYSARSIGIYPTGCVQEAMRKTKLQDGDAFTKNRQHAIYNRK